MAKTEWSKLKGNPSPDFFACIDGPITIDEDTVVLYSKKEPNRIGDYYRSGNYSKIIKAEWRQDKYSSKFVYVLHEDKASEYITNGGTGLIATCESGIYSKDYAQPEDYQNFPQTKDKDIADSNGTTKKEKPEIKSSSNNHKRSLIGWLFFIPWWIIKTLFKTIFWFFK
jgi:hypothetical protein